MKCVYYLLMYAGMTNEIRILGNSRGQISHGSQFQIPASPPPPFNCLYPFSLIGVLHILTLPTYTLVMVGFVISRQDVCFIRCLFNKIQRKSSPTTQT